MPSLDEALTVQGFAVAADDEQQPLCTRKFGSCLLLAAAKDPRLKAFVLAAPIDTMPSSIAAAKELRAPVSMIVAKDDWLASPDKGSVPIYKAAPAPKQLHVITGSSNAFFYDGEGESRAKVLRIRAT